MPSIFLCHASVDKPFVEKLALDMKRLGINVWFDKWEIKIGHSILWQIESGIRENEFLGLVMSPEAFQSEWVKTEISSAWAKQIKNRKVVVLPIYLRQSEIPWFLSDLRYADFRSDYNLGFKEIVSVLGISEIATLSESNWRWFAQRRRGNWQYYREQEFKRLVTSLVDRAKEYNWSTWTGGSKNPFSITLQAWISTQTKMSISIKLSGKTQAYFATFKDEYNPNNIRSYEFDIYLGNSVNEVEEFVWRHIEDFYQNHGKPKDTPTHFVHRYLKPAERNNLIKDMMKGMSWYQGDPLP